MKTLLVVAALLLMVGAGISGDEATAQGLTLGAFFFAMLLAGKMADESVSRRNGCGR